MKCPGCGADNSVKRAACCNCGRLLVSNPPPPEWSAGTPDREIGAPPPADPHSRAEGARAPVSPVVNLPPGYRLLAPPPAEPPPKPPQGPRQAETPLGDAFDRGFWGCAGAGCFLVALVLAVAAGCVILAIIAAAH